MDKLRTLKELEWDDKKIYVDLSKRLKRLENEGIKTNIPLDNQGKHIDSNELRAEAVAWIKELERLEKSSNLFYPPEDRWISNLNFEDSDVGGFYQVINWIKYFFNLTEEDVR